MNIASLTLGITGLFAWFDPFLCIPICIAGITTGIISIVKSQINRKRAIWGLCLSSVGLVASITWAIVAVLALLGMMTELLETFEGFEVAL